MAGRTVIRVTVDETDHDAALDALLRHRPMAVTEERSADGRLTLTAGFSDEHLADDVVRDVGARFVVQRPALDPDGWVTTWRQTAQPYEVGRFRVRLPEHEPTGAAVDIEIEPSGTFGYGHESTRLALRLLSDVEVTDLTVADVGSGSGILAIAAALFGAASVDAVDIDAAARLTTASNARRNGVPVTVRSGSVDALPLPAYDLVLANMTARTLCDLAGRILERLTPTGQVIVSGLLHGQRERVAAAFEPLVAARIEVEGEWAALLLSRGLTPGKRGREPHKIQSS